MNTVQAWMIVGIPALLGLAALFVGRSKIRALAGYVLLAAVVVFFVVVPASGVSAGVFGLIGVLLVANGRGTNIDEQYSEHHENRRRFTRDPSHA